MANVNTDTDRLLPQAGSDSSGRKFAFLNGVTKAAQNDTVTLVSANSVEYAFVTNDSDGAFDPVTISGNVITLTSADTGTVSGVVVYK